MHLSSLRPCARFVTVFAATTLLAVASFGQAPAPNVTRKVIRPNRRNRTTKRVLWMIPEFRTFPTLNNYKPITPKEKFKIASDDSFDRALTAGHTQAPSQTS